MSHDATNSNNFQLLLKWLDSDPIVAGQKYEVIRKRLISILYTRGCYEANEVADAAIDRVITKVPTFIDSYEGDPAHYFLRVAKYLFKEWLNERRKAENISNNYMPPVGHDEGELECLDECLDDLKSRDKEMILAYYHNENLGNIESRRRLAEHHGLSNSALHVKMWRIREKLAPCLESCIGY